MANVEHSIFWWDTESVEPGPALSERIEADVCIVGGGYTGMWAAWFLSEAEPSLDIHVVESDWAGAGASGHNDGYAMTVLDMSLGDLVAKHGPERAGAAHEAVARSVVEIGEWCERNGVDAEYERNGFLAVATNPGQLWRLERDHAAAGRIGAEHDFEILDAAAARDRVGSPAVRAALREGRGALLNPLKLARGLARRLRERGAAIHEQTPALEVQRATGAEKAHVVTPAGGVSADTVIVATNAYQHRLRQFRRKTIPLWSYAMVSEPLSEEQLGRVAWPGREGFEDKRNYITIGRLTRENRVLWGGRVAPYFLGNDMDTRHMRNDRVHRELRQAFDEFFPMWDEVRFTHAYGGASASPPRSSPTSARSAGACCTGTASTATASRRATRAARRCATSRSPGRASTRVCCSSTPRSPACRRSQSDSRAPGSPRSSWSARTAAMTAARGRARWTPCCCAC